MHSSLIRSALSRHVVVIGSGSAGISTAARLSRASNVEVTVIDGAKMHYYQPIWTLVGAGLYDFKKSGKEMKSIIPKGTRHIEENVQKILPESNTITLIGGTNVSYDALVLATGLELAFDEIEGLTDALENDPRVASNYSPIYVKKTFPAIQSFKGGNAIFTQPPQPIKCAGAPQKIMWLAHDIWTKDKLEADVYFNTAAPSIFAVPKYASRLSKMVEDRHIKMSNGTNLVSVDHVKGEATFRKEELISTQKYDFLHVTPPQRPVKLFREDESDLTIDGWVAVNKNSMQHDKFENIFSLGDCSNIPTSKTAAAVAAQNTIVAENVQNFLNNKPLNESYNGYTSCPLVTSTNTVMLAEFDFDLKPQESFFLDQGVNRRTMYMMKKYGFTNAYWELMVKGLWSGPGPFKIFTNPLNWN